MSKKKENKKILKFGMEFELMTLDSQGRVTNGQETMLKSVKKSYPGIDICKEVGKNMIELNSFPHAQVTNIMEKAMEDFESTLYAAEKEDIVLYPLGTYPGKFTPKFNKDPGYKIKEQIFGKTRFSIAGRCIGLHCHYTLPKGVFDWSTKSLKRLINSKNKQLMMNTYNLFIAMDPALMTFSQSSPYYQGKHLGKNSRAIVYRGGAPLDYPQGLYANLELFGQLGPYKYTGTDLIQIIGQRFEEWTDMVKKLDTNLKVFAKHGSILDTTWNPVKINSHGTLEQRGMDMNYPQYIIAIAMMIKHIAKEVQENEIYVTPSDIGMNEPFKREGDKIYIPPHTHVRFDLQRKAAYEGLDNKEIYKYCNGLYKLAKAVVPNAKYNFLEPIEKMISARMTVSDKLLKDAKKLGVDPKKGPTDTQSAELALRWSKDLFKEVVLTKKALHSLNGQ